MVCRLRQLQVRQCFMVPQVKKQEQRNDLDISKKQEIALFLKQLDNDVVKKTFQEVVDLFSAKWETDIHEAAVRRIKKSRQAILDAMPAIRKRIVIRRIQIIGDLLECLEAKGLSSGRYLEVVLSAVRNELAQMAKSNKR